MTSTGVTGSSSVNTLLLSYQLKNPTSCTRSWTHLIFQYDSIILNFLRFITSVSGKDVILNNFLLFFSVGCASNPCINEYECLETLFYPIHNIRNTDSYMSLLRFSYYCVCPEGAECTSTPEQGTK